jgi:hypothetical protein
MDRSVNIRGIIVDGHREPDSILADTHVSPSRFEALRKPLVRALIGECNTGASMISGRERLKTIPRQLGLQALQQWGAMACDFGDAHIPDIADRGGGDFQTTPVGGAHFEEMAHPRFQSPISTG